MRASRWWLDRDRAGYSGNSGVGGTHYEVLGVARTATDRQIKKRFFELSKKYHPDKTRTLQEEDKVHSNRKFQKIKEAYDTLSNKALRTSYDHSLGSGSAGSSGSNPYYNTGPGDARRPSSGQTHVRRRKVYNYDRPYANPQDPNSGRTSSSSSSSSHPDHPLNPGFHRTGSNHDVPHFDFDKHFKQQQGYEQHRLKRVQERAAEIHSHHTRLEHFDPRRSTKLSLSAIGTLSAVAGAVALFAYFH
ncbi:Chaperone protein dnaJ [Sugiyamaella lignohabitans]|uniref:Chaperone protein dnaJ n=1 Tax=Sugiyamaella lignohabitans TaxID=796027 RepID=A0A167DRL4_9ASCO|nr:Chaperone protein dnaJ [Sugiyamaella lignohabitans]ANB13208.1 Chaperone protein dnaJ [Sugiyamaella lignohabitans]